MRDLLNTNRTVKYAVLGLAFLLIAYSLATIVSHTWKLLGPTFQPKNTNVIHDPYGGIPNPNLPPR